MPNAYKVANEILKDRFEENNMSNDYEKIIKMFFNDDDLSFNYCLSI